LFAAQYVSIGLSKPSNAGAGSANEGVTLPKSPLLPSYQLVSQWAPLSVSEKKVSEVICSLLRSRGTWKQLGIPGRSLANGIAAHMERNTCVLSRSIASHMRELSRIGRGGGGDGGGGGNGGNAGGGGGRPGGISGFGFEGGRTGDADGGSPGHGGRTGGGAGGGGRLIGMSGGGRPGGGGDGGGGGSGGTCGGDGQSRMASHHRSAGCTTSGCMREALGIKSDGEYIMTKVPNANVAIVRPTISRHGP
jgi:hypothetical protein